MNSLLAHGIGVKAVTVEHGITGRDLADDDTPSPWSRRTNAPHECHTRRGTRSARWPTGIDDKRHAPNTRMRSQGVRSSCYHGQGAGGQYGIVKFE